MSVHLSTNSGGSTGGVSLVHDVSGPIVQPPGADQTQAIEPISQAPAKKVDAATTTLVRFNTLARELVAKNKTVPPTASRIYAILSLAQLRAVEAAQKDPTVNASAAIAGASEAVLRSFYPNDSASIAQTGAQDRPRGRCMMGQGSSRSGKALGEQIAAAVLESRKDDGFDAKWIGRVPDPKPGVWRSTANPPAPPLLPLWGDVKPFFMPEKGATDRPAPPAPPSVGSREFQSALAEVRRISDTRTDEQLRIAMFWADNPGTATPPGHWNQIASDYLMREKASPMEAAKVLAAINAAMMDAGIACWQSKFDHWLIRPSQADTQITVPEDLGLPNFPAYVSGHASFSGAGAAVLGHFFPEHAEKFDQMADEAAISRVYGGIHYMFDGTEGVKLGKAVAQFSIDAMK